MERAFSKVLGILFYGHESTFSSRCQSIPRKRLTVAFLLAIFALVLVVEPLPVHAAPSLVQQNKAYCLSDWSPAPCTSATMSVSFASSVASGDVVLVAVHSGSSISITVSSVSDSLGSSFTQAVMSSNLIGNFFYEYIYYATLSSSGPDQITVTFSSPPTQYSTVFYVFIYELSGVTTTGATTGTGAGDYGAPVSTTATAFQSGAFLLAIIGNNIMSTVTTPGSGFTLSPDDSASQILGMAHVQYSTSGVSSPTTFPATFDRSNKWAEAGIALNPIPEIFLSPTCGPPGTVVSLSGSGFGSSEHDPTISSSPDGLISDAQITIGEGIVSGTFMVAAGAEGSYLVTVHTVGIGQSASADFNANCPSVVGGVVMPTNTLALLAPGLAVIGLAGCIGTLVVIAKKREH